MHTGSARYNSAEWVLSGEEVGHIQYHAAYTSGDSYLAGMVVSKLHECPEELISHVITRHTQRGREQRPRPPAAVLKRRLFSSLCWHVAFGLG